MRLGVVRMSVPVEIIPDLFPVRNDDARRVKEPVVSGNVLRVVFTVAVHDAPRYFVWKCPALPSGSILIPKMLEMSAKSTPGPSSRQNQFRLPARPPLEFSWVLQNFFRLGHALLLPFDPHNRLLDKLGPGQVELPFELVPLVLENRWTVAKPLVSGIWRGMGDIARDHAQFPGDSRRERPTGPAFFAVLLADGQQVLADIAPGMRCAIVRLRIRIFDFLFHSGNLT